MHLLLFSCSAMCDILRPHGTADARLPHPSPTEYYSAVKKKELLPLATTWTFMLSEISQSQKKNTTCQHLHK